MKIRAILESDRDWAAALITQHFGTPEIISRGVRHDTRSLPGLVAERGGERLGLLHYCVDGKRCEVVALVAIRQRQGLGRWLLSELASVAHGAGCSCLWLVTTNDNRSAQQFYNVLGWRQVAVHEGAVALSRRLKPEIPERAEDGTPIVDEIEYELQLDAA